MRDFYCLFAGRTFAIFRSDNTLYQPPLAAARILVQRDLPQRVYRVGIGRR